MDHFEKPEEKVDEIKIIDDPVEEPDEMGLLVEPIQEVPKKVKKPRKAMTAEHKAKLAENLKKARIKSLASRKVTKKENDIKKIKTLEVKLAVEDKDKNERIAKKEAELEAKIEARLRIKIANEFSHASKDDKIKFLSDQLNNRNKYSSPLATINEEKTKEKPKPPERVVNVHSPFKHNLLFNKYRKF